MIIATLFLLQSKPFCLQSKQYLTQFKHVSKCTWRECMHESIGHNLDFQMFPLWDTSLVNVSVKRCRKWSKQDCLWKSPFWLLRPNTSHVHATVLATSGLCNLSVFYSRNKRKTLKRTTEGGKKTQNFYYCSFQFDFFAFLFALIFLYTEGTSLNSYFSCPSNGFIISFSTKKQSINSFILNTIADFLF